MKLFKLNITLADGKQIEHELDAGMYSVGRENCDIVLLDAGVSVHHANIEVTPFGVNLSDAGSSNGTWVNQEQIYDTVSVDSSHDIRLGGTNIRVTPCTLGKGSTVIMDAPPSNPRCRGKVIALPTMGPSGSQPGILVIDEKQYPFVLEGLWKAETAPKLNMTVEVEISVTGELKAIYGVNLRAETQKHIKQVSNLVQDRSKKAAQAVLQQSVQGISKASSQVNKMPKQQLIKGAAFLVVAFGTFSLVQSLLRSTDPIELIPNGANIIAHIDVGIIKEHDLLSDLWERAMEEASSSSGPNSFGHVLQTCNLNLEDLETITFGNFGWPKSNPTESWLPRFKTNRKNQLRKSSSSDIDAIAVVQWDGIGEDATLQCLQNQDSSPSDMIEQDGLRFIALKNNQASVYQIDDDTIAVVSNHRRKAFERLFNGDSRPAVQGSLKDVYEHASTDWPMWGISNLNSIPIFGIMRSFSNMPKEIMAYIDLDDRVNVSVQAIYGTENEATAALTQLERMISTVASNPFLPNNLNSVEVQSEEEHLTATYTMDEATLDSWIDAKSKP